MSDHGLQETVTHTMLECPKAVVETQGESVQMLFTGRHPHCLACRGEWQFTGRAASLLTSSVLADLKQTVLTCPHCAVRVVIEPKGVITTPAADGDRWKGTTVLASEGWVMTRSADAPKTTAIEYFEAATHIGDEKQVELFKTSEGALAHITRVFEAHVVHAREKASTRAGGVSIEDDVLARHDPDSLFHRKVVWAAPARRASHVIWHKDYFYVTRKTLTLRD